jgi:hypothetical protein
VILLLNEGHCGLPTAANGASLPLQEGARRISLVKLRAIIVDSGNQESDTIGASHRLALLAFIAFTEIDGKIADSLGDLFNGHGLGIIESVILSFNSGVIDQNTSISNDTTHSASAMSIDLYTTAQLV